MALTNKEFMRRYNVTKEDLINNYLNVDILPLSL